MDKLKIIALTSVLVTLVSSVIFNFVGIKYACGYLTCSDGKGIFFILYQNELLFFYLALLGGIVWLITTFLLRKKSKKWSNLFLLGFLMLVFNFFMSGYLSGMLCARTAVVLSMDPFTSVCHPNNGTITVYITNDGICDSEVVNVSITPSTGNAPICETITSITSGLSANSTCVGRTGGAGYYQVRASATGASTSGQIYCSS